MESRRALADPIGPRLSGESELRPSKLCDSCGSQRLATLCAHAQGTLAPASVAPSYIACSGSPTCGLHFEASPCRCRQPHLLIVRKGMAAVLDRAGQCSVVPGRLAILCRGTPTGRAACSDVVQTALLCSERHRDRREEDGARVPLKLQLSSKACSALCCTSSSLPPILSKRVRSPRVSICRCCIAAVRWPQLQQACH